MKETIESINGTVAVANKNPSPDEIIAGIKTIKTGSNVDGKTITKNDTNHPLIGVLSGWSNYLIFVLFC